MRCLDIIQGPIGEILSDFDPRSRLLEVERSKSFLPTIFIASDRRPDWRYHRPFANNSVVVDSREKN